MIRIKARQGAAIRNDMRGGAGRQILHYKYRGHEDVPMPPMGSTPILRARAKRTHIFQLAGAGILRADPHATGSRKDGRGPRRESLRNAGTGSGIAGLYGVLRYRTLQGRSISSGRDDRGTESGPVICRSGWRRQRVGTGRVQTPPGLSGTEQRGRSLDRLGMTGGDPSTGSG